MHKTDPGSDGKLVAHLVHGYLGHTLNWIYTQIKHSQGYGHYVLTSQARNLEDYPVELFALEHTGFLFYLIERVSRRFGYLPIHYFLRFSSVLQNHRPALLFAHFGREGYFSLGLKRKFKLPMITRFYGYDVGILPKIPMWHDRYKRLFEECDLFIAEGHYMKSSLARLGCPDDKIIVHHLGVELDKLEYRPRQPVPGKIRVLMAATFKEKKGFEYGLRALKKVVSELKDMDISIRIIGDGPLRDSLHALARELGLFDRIEWCGSMPPDFFYRALYEADVFLAPSVTAADGDTEGGSPVAITQACASGLPVVSTSHADIPEVVIHGENGLLAPERDVDGLAQAMVRLAKDPGMRLIFGEKGRAHIEKNYNAVTQGRALTGIFDRVINRAQPIQ